MTVILTIKLLKYRFSSWLRFVDDEIITGLPNLNKNSLKNNLCIRIGANKKKS